MSALCPDCLGREYRDTEAVLLCPHHLLIRYPPRAAHSTSETRHSQPAALTPADLDRLEGLARAATPGKRAVYEGGFIGAYEGHNPNAPRDKIVPIFSDTGSHDDIELLLACDREAILALVALARKGLDDGGMPRWIPVEERLPEERGSCVLASYGGGHGPSLAIVYHDGAMWRRLDDRVRDSVTHWQPLPAPPEGR